MSVNVGASSFQISLCGMIRRSCCIRAGERKCQWSGGIEGHLWHGAQFRIAGAEKIGKTKRSCAYNVDVQTATIE